MSASFGPHAVRLYALAARTLGWLPDHFWNATPAELASALCEPAPGEASPLGRAELNSMMEQDNG
jgi:uncharacterized phage protein (TIGR02216 family)